MRWSCTRKKSCLKFDRDAGAPDYRKGLETPFYDPIGAFGGSFLPSIPDRARGPMTHGKVSRGAFGTRSRA